MKLIDEQTEKNVDAITENLLGDDSVWTMEQSEAANFGLNPTLTFDNFSQGKQNVLACTIGMHVASHLGNPLSNPLYICGGVGVGKTHLMHAIGSQTLVQHPNARIQYIHSDKLVYEIVRAYRNCKFNDFRRHFTAFDLLLIDDIHLLEGKTRTQLELMHIIGSLLDNEKQLVVSSYGANSALAGFSDTLRDRLSAGLHLHLDFPGVDLRVAILQAKATQENAALNEDVALFISENSGASVRQLEGALKRVIAFTRFNEESSTERPITLSLAQEALGR